MAQFGRALRLGRRGRRFKSCYPDHFLSRPIFMKKKSENWLKIARYDLKAAQLAYDGNLYLTCIEKCHDALEKLLKSIITENDKQPQKIHDLLRLATEAIVGNLQQDILDVLNDLNNIYMSTRYPDEIEIIEKSLDDDETKRIFKETKRIFIWLEKKLPQN